MSGVVLSFPRSSLRCFVVSLFRRSLCRRRTVLPKGGVVLSFPRSSLRCFVVSSFRRSCCGCVVVSPMGYTTSRQEILRKSVQSSSKIHNNSLNWVQNPPKINKNVILYDFGGHRINKNSKQIEKTETDIEQTENSKVC